MALLTYIRLGWEACQDKQSSLLQTFVNYDHKMFCNIGLFVTIENIGDPAVVVGNRKLEWFVKITR